ncbi:MAG: cation transporter [Mailhella sp.]|nr:cation transporter [Mailhella sp.]
MSSVLTSITSFIDGRVRLRHPALKNRELMQSVKSLVEGMDGVTAVQCNDVTGSLLIFYDPGKLSREELLSLAEQGAAFLEQSIAPQCTAKPLCQTLGTLVFGRSAGRLVNRVLLASLLCSLGGAAAGVSAMHKIAGGIFALACLQHVAAHRKLL